MSKKMLREKALITYFSSNKCYDGEFEDFVPIEYVGYCLDIPGHKNINYQIKFLKKIMKKIQTTINIFNKIKEENGKNKN